MAQFDIVKNNNKKSDVKLLLELQSDSVSLLNTIIVAPLRKANNFRDILISKIHIPLSIRGENYIAFISEMAAVSSDMTGEYVDNVKMHRSDFISAIDLLFTGF